MLVHFCSGVGHAKQQQDVLHLRAPDGCLLAQAKLSSGLWQKDTLLCLSCIRGCNRKPFSIINHAPFYYSPWL